MDGRSLACLFARCTVTWSPNFLAWVDCHIFLGMGLCPHVALRAARGALLLNVIEIIRGAIKSAQSIISWLDIPSGPAPLDLGFSKKTTPDYYRWGWVESLQCRATKFILNTHWQEDISYHECLSRLNLLPLPYWHEVKNLIFYFKCHAVHYTLPIADYVKPEGTRLTRHSSDQVVLIPKCRTKLF